MNAKAIVVGAVLVVGATELVLFATQRNDNVKDDAWTAARSEVERDLRPEDGLAFVPEWTSPVARMHFANLLTPLRVAPAEYSRFPRVFEVARGSSAHAELADWRVSREWSTGGLRVRVRENPSYARTSVDLVALIERGEADVNVGESRCAFQTLAPQAGSLGSGMTIPARRFQCAQAMVGASFLPDLDYHPRRCVYAQTAGGGAATTITFRGIALTKRLRGHHAIAVHQERDGTGAPVSLKFRVGETIVGTSVHHDQEGWKSFEFATAPGPADLAVEVTSSEKGRPYCFEAVALE